MQFEVGRTYWKPIRAELSYRALRDSAFRWTEGKGWFSRHFAVAGPQDQVLAFNHWLHEFARINNG